MPAILTQARGPAGWGGSPPYLSVEFGLFGAAALELEEVRVGREGHRGVPQLARFLAARDLGEHRSEERHIVDVDGRCADVIADRVHPGVVARAHRFVVG